MTLKLIIGNKNYSSWSMRPWIAMKAAGIAFDETVISLYVEGSEAAIRAHSPAGKVPILIDGEGIAKCACGNRSRSSNTWRRNSPPRICGRPIPAARAHARAISTEMHAGFVPLRQQCGMNMWRPPAKRDLSDDAKANIARIQAIWTDARTRFGAGGPFLFGRFCAADAMYAPIVSRFETYAIDVSAPVAAYMQAMIALPAWQEWRRAALQRDLGDPEIRVRLAGGEAACRRMPHEARHRQQELFVVVAAAVDRHEGARHPVRGGPDPVRLAARQCGFQGELAPYTPAGRVPVLVDGDTHVWETLAILEYLAEKFPDQQLWPADAQGARAGARARRARCMRALRRCAANAR